MLPPTKRELVSFQKIRLGKQCRMLLVVSVSVSAASMQGVMAYFFRIITLYHDARKFPYPKIGSQYRFCSRH